MLWKKEKIISDFCLSYIPFPATHEMVEELKKTPKPIVIWIADNEYIFTKIKQCEL